MKKNVVWSLTLILAACFTAFGQEPASIRNEQPPVPVEEIIRKFAEKEREFKRARDKYTFRQDVRIQELDARDRPQGEYHTVSDILFDDKGRRTEKIVSAPQPTLQRIGLTPEDLHDIQSIQPFVLTTDDVAKYKVDYVGKELIDEVDCYVFDVGPKVLEKGQRYFEGRIWVDDHDLQIVKTYGKAVPDIRGKKGEGENLFPKFETYREQVDEVYWFPTFTRALDTLNFSSGPVRIRQTIRYQNYKRFESDVKLTFGDVVDEGQATGVKPDKAPEPAKAEDPKKKKKP